MARYQRRAPVKFALALLCAVVVLASACGSGSDEDAGFPPVAAGEDVASGVLLTPAAAEATPGFVAADVVPGTGGAAYPDAAGALSALLNAGLASTFVVAYTTAGSDGEAGDAYTVTNRPPLSRIDVTNVGDSSPSSLTATRIGGATVNCSLQENGWQCSQITVLGAPLLLGAGPVVFPGEGDFSAGTIAEVEGRAIAGVPTRCFDVTDAVGTSRYCVSGEGVPLYFHTPSTTVEATAYSTDVLDAAFELPVGE